MEGDNPLYFLSLATEGGQNVRLANFDNLEQTVNLVKRMSEFPQVSLLPNAAVSVTFSCGKQNGALSFSL